MKRFLALILALTMVLSLAACGGSGDDGDGDDGKDGSSKSTMSTETVTVDAVCVDDSYRDDDESPLRMVYVFMTLTPADENMKTSSDSLSMTIGESNTYNSEHYPPANKYADSYYYSSYLKDIYVGTEFKLVATILVPEGDLTAGKAVTLNSSQIADMEGIHFTTDDIQHFNSDEDVTKAADPDGYAAAMAAREPADEETAAFVKNYITQYAFNLYMGGVSLKLSFSDDNFKLKSSLGTNSGTYVIQKEYIVCTYDSNGYSVEIPYTIEGEKVDLDTAAAFDPRK